MACMFLSPLMTHRFSMRHQIIWCASLAAIDGTGFSRAGGLTAHFGEDHERP
jgi:hypothetical protein